MSLYTEYRLVKLGVVVAYLTPIGGINAVSKANIFAADRAKGKGTIARDNLQIRHEVVVQGDFVHSNDLPAAHRAALQSLFSTSQVTPDMQRRRVDAARLAVGGQFDLYLGGDQYTATSESGVSYARDGNTYPQVTIDEFRWDWDGNPNRIMYTLKFIVGFEKSSGEEES